ncbi:glycosyltransferase [Leuconostoc citreum]|nr:glycosyltransferase [Leuconostoc citreum]QOY97237.1 glycosyltransferase [Leuconostoc citreum]
MSVYSGSNSIFFKESLESIVEQTVLPNQLIIIKDGPVSDNVEKIISSFVDQFENIKIKVIPFQKNVGLGVGLAKGVLESDYELIARMDSDDIATKDRFELQLKMFAKDKNLDIIGGQLFEFTDKITNTVGQRRVPLDHEHIVEFAKQRSPLNHPTVMFKKQSIIAAGNYGDFRNFEDYDLWIRAINYGLKFANSDQKLIYMRVGDGLYKRRGGVDYLVRYYKLKNNARRLGVGSTRNMLYCDLIMTVNVLMPSKLREKLYKNLLHV